MNKTVRVRDVWEYFGYRRITGDDQSLERIINGSNVNRPGLELTGYFEQPTDRVMIVGDRELNYINNVMSPQQQEEVFDFLTQDNIPMILFSRDLAVPEILLRIANEKNFPIFSSYAKTNTIIVELMNYLEEFFAPTDSVHGVLLQMYGRGVLITGESGIGKSEIAFELIKRGHVLIADDRIDIYRAHNQIFGEAPEILKNMLELRGVGIQNVVSMFGAMAAGDKTDIELIVELVKYSPEREFDRLGLDNNDVETMFGIDLPKMVVPISEGRSAAVLIEAAVSSMIMRKKGYDSAERFKQRLNRFIESQKEGK